MATNLMLAAGTSSFRIKRPLITTNGFVADVDPTIKQHLDELDAILGYGVFTSVDVIARTPDGNEPTTETPKTKLGAREATTTNGSTFPLIPALRKPLIAKRTTSDHWDNTGILNDLASRSKYREMKLLSIGDCIDKTNELAKLKYELNSIVAANRNTLDFNSRLVLQYSNITDYLVAYAYFVKEISDIKALSNFIYAHKQGIKNIIQYAVISTARFFIQKESLKIDDYPEKGTEKVLTYNDDTHPLMLRIAQSGLPLSAVSFKKELSEIIDNYIYNSVEMRLISKANIGNIPDSIKPMLVKYIRSSPITITEDNVNFFLPLFISKINGGFTLPETTDTDVEESDRDFDVDFFEDDRSMVQVSISNVKCAAQLFYCMVVGEELDVFNVVNYFTHKFLVRGGIEIQDQQLREHLQLYVFSNKFIDLKTKRIMDRTQDAERQMFYRQVFEYGNAQVTEDIITNNEFRRLWKLLIYESAKYLEKAQASLNPDSYVSRQNVMQAVEDLQYNLSMHCSGMANVITPIIYAELNFVIRKIFMHPEVLRQVVPVGSTWWRLVETLYAAMKQRRPKATVLYNKAKLGQQILRSIAEYNPASFEDDKVFSDFMSMIDALITTQSILQESLEDDLKKQEEEEQDPGYLTPPGETVAALPGTNGNGGSDEWDF